MISRIDKALGGHVTKLLDKAAAKMFGGWEEIHAMGFNKAEEDEAPFALSMTSAGIFLLFPYLHLFKEQWLLDNDDEKVKKHLMHYYINCVKRFMYAAGKNKTYLSKNVMMSGRIETLMKFFPDARFIFIVRHPYKVLPSFVSMFAIMYRVHSPQIKDNDAAMQAWAELGMEFYLHFNKFKNNIDNAKIVNLKYDSFVAMPAETVKNIYSQFQFNYSSHFETKLLNEVNLNKHFKSSHSYSLEQYGLSKETIADKLHSVFETYGFDK